jgi:hypothetical protein
MSGLTCPADRLSPVESSSMQEASTIAQFAFIDVALFLRCEIGNDGQ